MLNVYHNIYSYVCISINKSYGKSQSLQFVLKVMYDVDVGPEEVLHK